MTRPLKVGVQLPEVEWEVPFAELIAMARAAEAVGFDSIWVGDHLLYDLPVGPRGPWEAWTSLAALAAVTERVEIGPLVASIGFHAPTMLAKQAATIDAISGGRLIVGLGAGWNEREYRAFGFAYDHRVSRFEEALTIIRQLLREGRCDLDGTYYRVEDCILHPRSPRPAGPPLMLGSTSARMLSIGLPHVDQWNVWWSIYGNTPDGFAREKARVDDAVEAAGRAPGSVEATCAVHVRMAEGQGRQMGHEDGPKTRAIIGSPSEIADQLRAFAAAGAAHVQLVIDPITRATIEACAPMLADLDRG
jgi:alkanesulfonate monooxygenase SsuD/methylene tetrahydromethanopterin reductase-like flavin-dependent oxidoreductase (luciferase family)